MIQVLIFVLIIVVIVLAIIASRPRSILRNVSSFGNESSVNTKENLVSKQKSQFVTPTVQTKKKRENVRVRFSPDKKERTYNIKTGEVTGEATVQVGNSELDI